MMNYRGTRKSRIMWSSKRSAETFLNGQPGLREALACGHRITNDLAAKLQQYKSLSAAQCDLAYKLHSETFCPARPARAAEVNVAAPEGRQTIRGTVVSIKEHESAFGRGFYGRNHGAYVLKMTVKVTTDAGTWLCWGTVPSGIPAVAKGSEIEFTATLQRGREAHFAFFKRPANAHFITPPTPEAQNAAALRELENVKGQLDPMIYAQAKANLLTVVAS